MLLTYAKNVEVNEDVQLENLILDRDVERIGSTKIVSPISIRNVRNGYLKRLLVEVSLGLVKPLEKVRVSLSMNGVIITREIRPQVTEEIGGFYWVTEVFDSTELFRNRLNKLFQKVRVHVNDNNVLKMGNVTIFTSFEVEEAVSNYKYLVGPHLVNKEERIALNTPSSGIDDRNEGMPVSLTKLLTYSPDRRFNLKICKATVSLDEKKCDETAGKIGFSEIHMELSPTNNEVEIYFSDDSQGKNALLVQNAFIVRGLYRVPLISLENVSYSKKSSSIDLEITLRIHNDSTGWAQFILVNEGMPVARQNKRIDKKGMYRLIFRDLDEFPRNLVLRTVLFKYSKTWIKDIPINISV